MTTTAHYGFQEFPPTWLDERPGSGVVEVANSLLENVDAALWAAGGVTGAVLRAPSGDQTIVGAHGLNLNSIALSGVGKGTIAGQPSLADFFADDGDSDWLASFRAASAPSAEVLTFEQDSDGDFFISVRQADGTLLNRIIMRGLASGGYIRFGPDQTHGIAISKLVAGRATLALDGDVQVNTTDGSGALFGSIGGGNVTVKPANFSSVARTQLLPNADGTFLLDVLSLSVFANNAAAISGGLTAGKLYRTGANPDAVCIVH